MNRNNFKQSLCLAIIIMVVFFVYHAALSGGFVIDDNETIINNSYIKSFEYLGDFFTKKEPTAPQTHLKYEIFRPLKTLSVACDFYFSELNPRGFHRTNIILHIIVVLLLFILVKKLTSSDTAALISALVFGVNPSLVHNVSYISARSDIICAIFLLLVFKVVFFDQKTSIKIDLQVLFFFILSMMSKETALALPIFMLLFYKKYNFNLKRSLLLFFSALVWFIYRFLILDCLSQGGFLSGSLLLTQLTMIKSWVYYLSGFFWPVKTLVIPNIGMEPGFNLRVFIFMAILSFIVFLFYKLLNKEEKKWTLLGVFFLLPVANFIPIKAFFSWRFVYIPYLCFSIALALRIKRSSDYLKYFMIFFIIIQSGHTFHLVGQYKNDLTLWRPVMEKYPDLSKPYRVISRFYLKENNFTRALDTINKGLANINNDPWLLWEKGRFFLIKKEYAKAYDIINSIPLKKRLAMGEYFYSDWVFINYQKEDFKKIAEEFKLLDYKEFYNRELLFLTANALVIEGEKNAALRIFTRLLKKDDLPENMQKDINNIVAIMQRERII